jgi:Leucine-rich repeat (LRR) protein
MVPPEIDRLKGLTQFNLSLNSLRGEVPQAVGNLTNLEVLDLSSNRLTGEIPRALESLHFLSYFNVSNNDLDGPVPAPTTTWTSLFRQEASSARSRALASRGTRGWRRLRERERIWR